MSILRPEALRLQVLNLRATLSDNMAIPVFKSLSPFRFLLKVIPLLMDFAFSFELKPVTGDMSNPLA